MAANQQPSGGKIKINFDVSVVEHLVVGFGLLAGDHEGEVLAATSAFPLSVLSPLIAEAFCWALSSDMTSCFGSFCFEIGYLQLYETWMKT